MRNRKTHVVFIQFIDRSHFFGRRGATHEGLGLHLRPVRIRNARAGPISDHWFGDPCSWANQKVRLEKLGFINLVLRLLNESNHPVLKDLNMNRSTLYDEEPYQTH